MKKHRLVSLNLPEDLLAAIGRAARAADISATEYVRDRLVAAVAASAVRAAITAAPRVDLTRAHTIFDSAYDWIDLQSRLRRAGFVLRQDGAAGLALHTWPRERRLVTVQELGHSLTALAVRFRAPFPGYLPGTRMDLMVDRTARPEWQPDVAVAA